MLTDAFLDIVKGLITWMISGLPQWTMPHTGGFQNLVLWLRQVNLILPVLEIFRCATLYTTIVYGWTVVKWTIKVIDYVAAVIP